MTDGITVRILGDFGPFSSMGKSITYQITIGRSIYLIDCGAPLFQQIGSQGLKEIKGLIITHCHDDHKRWFTDLALFNMYAPDISNKIFFLTSEDIHNELIRSSGPALDRSLSNDSKNIIDIACEEYTDFRIVGPRAKYRIVSVDEGDGKTALCIIDRNGNVVGPDIAKIVISKKTKRPRMLFKDPDYNEWVEPESFYPFSSSIFYEEDRNIYKTPEGFTFEAIKSAVWHGVPCIGIKITTDSETLIFSSDTVNDRELWRQLYTEKRVQRLTMSREQFESAAVIFGDINDYIERIWGEERYKAAINAFNNAIVIHDIAARNSIVHTDYEKLKNTSLKKEKVILTHSLDGITSEWVLCDAGKSFKIRGDTFVEMVGDKYYPMNADIYHKEGGRYFVGYKNEEGRYNVYEKGGLLSLSTEAVPDLGTLLYRVDMYEDISGRYFPKLEEENVMYLERGDGRVELIEFTGEGSRGRIVEDHRARLPKGCCT
ncbi:MAG: MBL fold metallo-hydrolase [Nitrospirota bacterium]|nr:MBL fold metallo-hydrolase [Nitrospirota bacterium]